MICVADNQVSMARCIFNIESSKNRVFGTASQGIAEISLARLLFHLRAVDSSREIWLVVRQSQKLSRGLSMIFGSYVHRDWSFRPRSGSIRRLRQAVLGAVSIWKVDGWPPVLLIPTRNPDLHFRRLCRWGLWTLLTSGGYEIFNDLLKWSPLYLMIYIIKYRHQDLGGFSTSSPCYKLSRDLFGRAIFVHLLHDVIHRIKIE